MGLFYTLKFIADHPLTRGRRARAFERFLRWQIGSRIAPGPILVDFVNETKLIVSPGMTGATANIYVGLQEFNDMSFILHVLREQDLFLDIGANIGSYTLLAAAAGASIIAFEPVPQTFETLGRNLAVNGLADRVQVHRMAVGRSRGKLRFTTTHDTMNHVATSNDKGAVIEVPVLPLDEVVERPPIAIKIDVEGYEAEVIEGASRILGDEALQVVLMELNGSGERYGFKDADLHEGMKRRGFTPCGYDGLSRTLESLAGPPPSQGNVLYVRDLAWARARVQSAQRFRVIGQSV